MGETRQCDECGTSGVDVVGSPGRWYAWGGNAFHVAWEKADEAIHLCEECETEGFCLCEHCGYLISVDYYGAGYIPADESTWPSTYNGETVCPGCAVEKHGLSADIGPAPPRVAQLAATPTPTSHD